MKADGNDDDQPADRLAQPSPDETTHTSDSLASPTPAASGASVPPPVTTSNLRDRERYQILGEHGRGGLGRVSRAHDRDLGRDIAIKELISRGNVSELRFLREALITARLEHPGIVPVYEAGRWPDGTPFYAMKLVSGRSLRELLAERTTIESRIGLLHHVIAVADAIAYAHDRNIIHRDLKPSNVIVGEFGETIVIDWGLAKDLTTTEESTLGGGPFRVSIDDGLTSTGSVLGTPAYMAPEQGRGEPVDQRADVYAIGAMLWELCSLKKISPSYAGQRRRSLRDAGIDQDLATIIEKALDPDPKGRYADAGALAADLKAFKAGARIAARSYSLLAMLGHWTRRHRAVAASITALVTVAALAAGTYVRHIAAERDRVAVANNTLLLEHAALLLHTDPTAAFEFLNDYRGSDTTRLELLRAEARGLGVARMRATPHAQPIHFAHRLPDGTLVTVGVDGTVARTSLQGTTRVIARNVTQRAALDFAASRTLLAYSCDVSTICLLDVQTGRAQPSPADLSSFVPVGLAFSPSGEMLAAISARGQVSIWQVSESEPAVMRLEVRLAHGESLQFVDEYTLVTQSHDGVYVLHLGASGRLLADPIELAIPDASELRTSSELHLAAASTTAGELLIIDPYEGRITDRHAVCKGSLQLAIFAAQSTIGYACRDGDAGLWDLRRSSSSVLLHIDGGASAVAESLDGRYFIASGDNGTLMVRDVTSHMSTAYLGHAARIGILLAPSREFPYIVSCDSAGEMRVWPLPESSVRVAILATTRMAKALPLPDGTVVAIGDTSTIAWSSSSGATGEWSGHRPAHTQVAVSPTEPRFVAFGRDDEFELWAPGNVPVVRAVKTEHGVASAAAFMPDGAHFTVGNRDGTVVEWTRDGAGSRVLGTISEPVAFLRVLRSANAIVVGGTSGALWMSRDGRLTVLGQHNGPVASAATSHDSRWLAVANHQGNVRLYDISTGTATTFQSPRPWSEHLSFAPDSSTLAIATDKTISMVVAERNMAPAPIDPGVAQEKRRWTWSQIELAVRFFTFSADSEWFAATCDRGGIWFNRRGDRHWIYFSTGTGRISSGAFSTDGTSFVATDSSGRALMIDMRASIFH